MGKLQMPLGNDLFEKLRNDESYYVDKTNLIYEIVNDKKNDVTLFTRPRRFGKTLNMSMLDCFFDIRRDSKALFEGLAISERKDLCEQWQNKYPTIFVSFKEITGRTFDDAFGMMGFMLSERFDKYAFLLESSDIKAKDKRFLENILNECASRSDIQGALGRLSRILYEHYNMPVIILIDEYDVPISYANENGYYDEMIAVIRSMFSLALKTNPYLKFAVITGCMRIAKESIFTGTNNFVSYSVMDNEFSQYFGFTETEVQKLLEDCGLSDKADKVKDWYDGYIFGDTEVYCPWDVLNYVSALQSNPDARPKNYWRNTSHNGIIRSFVDKMELDIKDKFELLLNGGIIEQRIADDLTYNELYDSEDNLWSMLYMTGYVTKADHEVSDEEQEITVRLRIPNKEITRIFEDTVVKWFSDNIDRANQKNMMDALWSGDDKKATQIMSDFLWQTISYNDYHENYYHAFMAGIFTGSGYTVASNAESGLGRPDMIIKDFPNRKVLIIETKRAQSSDDMEKKCDEAIKQIEERQYAKGIPHGFRTVLCYGVAFFEKDCLVKLQTADK